jgi:hypothetical protein
VRRVAHELRLLASVALPAHAQRLATPVVPAALVQDGRIVRRLDWGRQGVAAAFGSDRVLLLRTDEDDVAVQSVYRFSPK